MRRERERILSGPPRRRPSRSARTGWRCCPAERRRPRRAGRAPGSDRPQPRGAADPEAAGAARPQPARRGLLLRRDRRDHRLTATPRSTAAWPRAGSGSASSSPRSEDGSRCEEMRPLLSAFCDGEASAEEAAALREHLRACAYCRATLRAYRAAPARRGGAGADPAARAARCSIAPTTRSPVSRRGSAVVEPTATRRSRRSPAAAAARGAGMAGLAKVAALCVGTAGGAAACVATGVVPAPLETAPEPARAPALERRLGPFTESPRADERSAVRLSTARTEKQPRPSQPAHPDTATAVAAPEPRPETPPEQRRRAHRRRPNPKPLPSRNPVAKPNPRPRPAGSPAGEFGP